MKALALELGVEETDIILEGESRDTRSQAVQLTPLLKEKPFLLVSSANHLQRAVARFEAQGLSQSQPQLFSSHLKKIQTTSGSRSQILVRCGLLIVRSMNEWVGSGEG